MNRRDLFKALAAVPVALLVKPDAANSSTLKPLLPATHLYTHKDVLRDGFQLDLRADGSGGWCCFRTFKGPAPALMDVVEVNLEAMNGPRFVGRVAEVETRSDVNGVTFVYAIRLGAGIRAARRTWV